MENRENITKAYDEEILNLTKKVEELENGILKLNTNLKFYFRVIKDLDPENKTIDSAAKNEDIFSNNFVGDDEDDDENTNTENSKCQRKKGSYTIGSILKYIAIIPLILTVLYFLKRFTKKNKAYDENQALYHDKA